MTEDRGRGSGAHEPDTNALAAHFEGRLDPTGTERLVSHLAECRSCRETSALMARALKRETLAAVRRPAAARWLALAAALVLATIVGIRVSRENAHSGREAEPVPTPARAEATAPAMEPSPPPAAAVLPEVKRGSPDRTIAGKTFRLVAGEWIDTSYDATQALPVVEIAGPQARRSLLTDHPALAPYLAPGGRVLVVLEGTVYRVSP